jgi:hypothetical protein
MGRIEVADARKVKRPFLLADDGKAIFYIDHIYNDTVRVVSEFRLTDGRVMRTTEWMQTDDSLQWRDPAE